VRLTPRRAVGALAALLTIAGLTVAPSAKATSDFALDRVAGNDRYATAAQVAQLAFPAGSDAVVVARGDAFPDALAGSYLTGSLGAPILLTMTDSVPKATSDAIAKLGAKTIYLLGGTSAISQKVEDGLKSGHTVTRIAGDDRYGTAAKVATNPGGGVGQTVDGATAFLASGLTSSDALAAGPVAHAGQFPILLTTPGALPAATKSALTSLKIAKVIVLGGTAAVGDTVVKAVQDNGAKTQRVAGNDRYATATKIADFASTTIADWSNEGIDLATGTGFADALAAGPAGGELKRSILLTAPTSLSAPTATWLGDHAGTLAEGRVFGGTAAVSNAVVAAAEAAGQGKSGGTLSGQLTFVDKASDVYRFVPDGAKEFQTVKYATGDTFTVDGASATMGGFETAVTPADTIRYTPAAGSAPARHELTNVDASKITSGTAGNVDVANHQLDFVNAVSGDALLANQTYSGKLYKVDGALATIDSFEKDLNEGDTVAITGTGAQLTWELTNADTTGSVNTITKSSLPPSATFKIGQLGDIPGSSGAGNDDVYKADGNPISSTDTFSVDGKADATFSDFNTALTAGDVVTYARKGGVQSFTLVNTPPATQKGQAVDGITADSDGDQGLLTPNDNDGGSFTLATSTGSVTVTYAAGGTFVVDGSIANEADFEAAYTAGDDISFRAGDTPSGTTQRLEVDNKTLAGTVQPTGVDTANDKYAVLASNGTTVLKTVTYVSSTASANSYFVNGAAATLESFEKELDAIKAGAKTGTIQVPTTGSGSTAVTQHKLTTVAKSA
jgi:putative cell wall-binding protein